jgi:hypothetical protein
MSHMYTGTKHQNPSINKGADYSYNKVIDRVFVTRLIVFAKWQLLKFVNL